MGKESSGLVFESVGVLPWLTLNEPIIVGDFTFLPAATVREVLGERYALLADRLRRSAIERSGSMVSWCPPSTRRTRISSEFVTIL
jgi:hypothetical protein